MKNYRESILAGKTIVLLGGTSGIGQQTAFAAAGEGARVIVVSNSQQNVDETLKLLPENSGGYVADLGEEMQVKQLFEKIGAFDHLIFTAGDQLSFSDLTNLDLKQAKQSMQIRLWGAILAVKYGAPQIRGKGSIVLTTGALGKRPKKGTAVVSAMASAIEGLTRALAVELAPIRVNAVCAGTVRTNLLAHLSEEEREALFDGIGSKLLTGRVGNTEDLAEAYLYLMRGNFTTGQIVVADGGSLLV